MRLAETVRIGGKLALGFGFVWSSLVFGTSLSYFTGYQSTSFGVSQASDPFSAQNVPFTPSVSMVSGSTVASTPTGGTASGVLTGSYGFSTAPQSTSPTSTPASNTPAATTFFVLSGGGTGSFGAPANVPAATVPTGSVPTGSNFYVYATAPSVLNSNLNTPALTGQVLTGGYIFGQTPVSIGAVAVKSNVSVTLAATNAANALAMPEPSTWMSMGMGLAFVLFKFRRNKA